MQSTAAHRCIPSREKRLEEFACFLGATVTFDEYGASSNDTSAGDKDLPKTRLDHVLSSCNGWSTATFPSLSLPSTFASTSRHATVAASDAVSPRDAASLASAAMSAPIRYRRDRREDLRDGPKNMAIAAASTFESLVRANLTSFAKLRDDQKSWGSVTSAESYRRGVLSNGTLVRVRKVSTASSCSCSSSSSSCRSLASTTSADESGPDGPTLYRIPIHLSFSFDVDVGGMSESFSLGVAGQGVGHFHPCSKSIYSADVSLNCPALLLALRQRARIIAYRIVSKYVSAEVLKATLASRRTTSTSTSTNTTATFSASITTATTQALNHVAERSVCRNVVTPCSSPLLLTTLSVVASSTMEPLDLDDADGKVSLHPPKRSVDLPSSESGCGEDDHLPPKKRPRHSIALNLNDNLDVDSTGVSVITTVTK